MIKITLDVVAASCIALRRLESVAMYAT